MVSWGIELLTGIFLNSGIRGELMGVLIYAPASSIFSRWEPDLPM